jgi:hypothetical protein
LKGWKRKMRLDASTEKILLGYRMGFSKHPGLKLKHLSALIREEKMLIRIELFRTNQSGIKYTNPGNKLT